MHYHMRGHVSEIKEQYAIQEKVRGLDRLLHITHWFVPWYTCTMVKPIGVECKIEIYVRP